MLAKVTLENFFSFGKKTEILLHPKVNVLVGINGSGKSNFLKALCLLYEGISGDGFKNTFLGVYGGFDGVAFGGNKNPIKLTFEFKKGNVALSPFMGAYKFEDSIIYEIVIHYDDYNDHTPYFLEEKIYSRQSEANNKELVFLKIRDTTGHLREKVLTKEKKENRYTDRKIIKDISNEGYDESELFLSQISDPERYRALHVLSDTIGLISVFGTFDTSQNGQVRDISYSKEIIKLLPNGSNVSYVLNHLVYRHKNHFKQIIKFLGKINPAFQAYEVQGIGNRLLLSLKEKGFDEKFRISIDSMSDGTLLYLIHLLIFKNPHQNMGLINLDEPEKGLHPDMINTIADLIKSETNKNLLQVIFATHSPLLLNKFSLDEILIFEKDKENQTCVSYKSEEDFEDWEGDFLTGQLWLNGELGGKRW